MLENPALAIQRVSEFSSQPVSEEVTTQLELGLMLGPLVWALQEVTQADGHSCFADLTMINQGNTTPIAHICQDTPGDHIDASTTTDVIGLPHHASILVGGGQLFIAGRRVTLSPANAPEWLGLRSRQLKSGLSIEFAEEELDLQFVVVENGIVSEIHAQHMIGLGYEDHHVRPAVEIIHTLLGRFISLPQFLPSVKS